MRRQPITWWITQADQQPATECPKCRGWAAGQYIAPTVGSLGECAVVLHCRTCGWERLVIAGRGGIPYTESPETEVEPRKYRAKLPGQRYKDRTGNHPHIRRVETK